MIYLSNNIFTLILMQFCSFFTLFPRILKSHFCIFQCRFFDQFLFTFLRQVLNLIYFIIAHFLLLKTTRNSQSTLQIVYAISRIIYVVILTMASLFHLVRPITPNDLSFLNWEDFFFYITMYKEVYMIWTEGARNWNFYFKNRAFMATKFDNAVDCSICFETVEFGIQTKCVHFFHE